MKNPVAPEFHRVYDKWVWKLEEILHQLLEVSKQRTQGAAGFDFKVKHPFEEYYTVKWASAHEDVLVFFSPTWLSPLENAYLWMTGWKPSMVLKLLETLKKQAASGGDFVMTEEQARKIEELRKRTRMEEEKVEREMERQQVAMADRKMVELVKLTTRARNGGGGGGDAVAEVALKGVLAGLERVRKASDCVRLTDTQGGVGCA
ncbi:hypothetical protein JHK87_041695 [Glycine soja]|nr:hypothetical protein JHK87_041695 [Glycine soja]